MISVIYFTIGNFESYERSGIDHIRLVLLCREIDQKQFGHGKVVEKLSADLEILDNT